MSSSPRPTGPSTDAASSASSAAGTGVRPPGAADVGLIGLAVMGQNLALNMADHGLKVAVYNRTTSVTDGFVAAHGPVKFRETGGALLPAGDLRSFVATIARPRRIVLMVKAGPPTSAVIDQLAPLLEPGDLVVDGGNADWHDTEARERALAERGLLFIGSGVSGGEEGARFGPSLMAGGTPEAWALLEPVWTAIAAKVDPRTGRPLTGAAPGKPVRGGVACAARVGPGGSGHFVKMVHNGIEYADMQLIGEAYDLLRTCAGLEPETLAGVFATWNTGDLDSFLIEITADILRQKDPRTGRPLVDVIRDAAGQKGTGRWTIEAALGLGVPAPTMAEAVFARQLSALGGARSAAAGALAGPDRAAATRAEGPAGDDLVEAARQALYCSKVCCYAQGFALMGAASQAGGWELDLGQVAQVWRGGCIIRARFLQKITDAYAASPSLPNLMLDPHFAAALRDLQAGWRTTVCRASAEGVPAPAFSSALGYYDALRSPRLPASLLQAQRDYFGAHSYERIDEPPGRFFHLDWTDPDRPELSV
ncbi:MAG TPA: NADP-dependent phosphogluconate dehydrogenase [Phycisphaerales bacterium]|nr:NADP-dependent phosphogluconate dehydrogenase [Phycisphaerales bacterium]